MTTPPHYLAPSDKGPMLERAIVAPGP